MQRPKVGGKSPLRIFLKGNHDLTASLLPVQEGGGRLTRGLRDLVREKYQGIVDVEIIREPCGRSDLLLQQLRVLPAGGYGAGPDPNLRAFTSDFDTRLFEAAPDVVVFSLQPEIAHPLWRHRDTGHLLFPDPGWQHEWPPAERQAFLDHFDPVGLQDETHFTDSFGRLIRAIKDRLEAHIIVFNCSSVDPADDRHNYHGVQDTLSVRIHRSNLALLELSVREGISIIDVDRLLAELGAEQHVREALRYSPHAYAAIRDEFVRVLEDIGFFEERPLVMQIGRGRD